MHSIRIRQIDLDDDEDVAVIHLAINGTRALQLDEHFAALPQEGAALEFLEELRVHISNEPGRVGYPEVVVLTLTEPLARQIVRYTGSLNGHTGNEATSSLYSALSGGVFNRFDD